jgi:cytochrome P450
MHAVLNRGVEPAARKHVLSIAVGSRPAQGPAFAHGARIIVMHAIVPRFRPPAPTPLPRPLGPLALLKALRRNPIECWTKAHFEEPIVLGGFPFARVAVVSDPPAIRQVLVENPSDYRKSALERRILSAQLRNGLVTVEGEQWGRQRRTLAPLFGQRMVRRLTPAMAGAAAALVGRWLKHPHDTVLDIKREMSRLALDALVRCIFADGLGNDPEAMSAALATFFATAGRIDPFDIIGLPDFVPRLTLLRHRAKLQIFDQALAAAIAARRRSLAEHPDAAPPDMLGVMLAATDPETGTRLSEAEVKGNVLTFVFAGQETTSTALTWAIYLLSQSPQWRERINAEAHDALAGPLEDATERLVETRAVIDEALRLYPPVIGITRAARRRGDLAGRSIERGTMVIVSPYVLHRHRRLWDDPDAFDPARFLPGAAKKVERFAYLPFGVGPRMCIGAAFALHEAALMLAVMMRNFTFELAPGQTVWPQQRFTLGPRDGLMMIVTRRLPG